MSGFYIFRRWFRQLFIKRKIEQINTRDPRVLDFELWAFGFPLPTNKLEKKRAWNRLHGKKLMIPEEADMQMDLPEMYAIYLQEKETFYGN